MVKRLFFVLAVLFVFSLLSVQVSAASEQPADGTYLLTITKIGFYIIEGDDPDSGSIVNLPSPQTVHIQFGGSTPSITDFVYLGNIPNGTFIGIGIYVESSVPTDPNLPTGQWYGMPFDNAEIAVPKTFNESSRNKITMNPGNWFATVDPL